MQNFRWNSTFRRKTYFENLNWGEKLRLILLFVLDFEIFLMEMVFAWMGGRGLTLEVKPRDGEGNPPPHAPMIYSICCCTKTQECNAACLVFVDFLFKNFSIGIVVLIKFFLKYWIILIAVDNNYFCAFCGQLAWLDTSFFSRVGAILFELWSVGRAETLHRRS